MAGMKKAGPRITRRTLLRTLASSVGLGCGLSLYAWRVEPHWLEIVRRPLPIANLPPAWHGRTLLQLSDLHVGPEVDDDYLLSTFERAATFEPDLVVLTGDLTSYHPEIVDQARAIYRHLPQGALGTFAILGNHDYGPNWAHPELAARLVDALEPMGLVFLRNRTVTLAGLQLTGLDDLWAGRFAPERALAALDPRRPSIVLTHNPDTADRPVWGDHRGWLLAGHTHGGQCKPPFLPPPLLPVRNSRYTRGVFPLAPGRKLYINRGVGHLTRIRFNVRPEVTAFTLTLAEA